MGQQNTTRKCASKRAGRNPLRDTNLGLVGSPAAIAGLSFPGHPVVLVIPVVLFAIVMYSFLFTFPWMDVTKEAADMILTDDNLATIVNAVDEGRAIFANIQKFVCFLLSRNIGEMLTMFGSVVLANV